MTATHTGQRESQAITVAAPAPARRLCARLEPPVWERPGPELERRYRKELATGASGGPTNGLGRNIRRHLPSITARPLPRSS